jgi:small conductance mechanosensitive channel
VDVAPLLQGPADWWRLAIAIVVAVLVWVASRFARRGILRLITRTGATSPGAALLVARTGGYAVILTGIGVGLSIFTRSVQPLLVVVVLPLVLVAFSLRGMIENFIAGLVLQARGAVRIGDRLQITSPSRDPLVGTVVDIDARAVELHSDDGRVAHVANTTLLTGTVVNESRLGRRRSEIRVHARAASATPVRGLVATATSSVDGVLTEPAPTVEVWGRTNDSVLLRVMFWHAPAAADAVAPAVVDAVGEALIGAAVPCAVTHGAATPPALLEDG